ncbi:MAG: metallopeptidase TldD-related protein [Myxococcota bacterium]
MIAVLLGLAHAQDGDSPSSSDSELLEALKAEMARASELSLPDAPPLYALRYRLALMQQREVHAELGSVLVEDATPYHGLGVELRVGTPMYDNTGFGGWENGFVRGSLAADPTPHDARQAAWRLTDLAYKQAVEQHARKSSQFTAPDDYPGDWAEMPPVVADDGWATLTGSDALRARVIELSDVFTPAGDRLQKGQVVLGQEAGGMVLIDRDGTEVRRPMEEVTLRAMAHLRTDDGQMLTDSRLWSVRQPDQLPEQAEMVAELERMRDDLLALAESPSLTDEYVGPVLFEGDAALDVFRYLLVPQLEGTPAEVPYDSWFGDLGEAKDPVRIGRRVLPEGWSASDDPRADPSHPSSFLHDWEGTPAQRVDLVDDGIVRDLLMSRVPRKGLAPNGHARGFLGYRASGRVTQLSVEPNKAASSKKLVKKGLKMAQAYGRDHVLVVRRLQEDAVRAADATSSMFGFTEEDVLRLPPPVEVVRVYADGREEVLRGARFASVQRFVLRDIALAGEQRTGTFLAPIAGDYASMSPTEGMPTRISAPDILVREIELVPTSGDPRDKPVLAPRAATDTPSGARPGVDPETR